MIPVVVDAWPATVAGPAWFAALALALCALPLSRARGAVARLLLVVLIQLGLCALGLELLMTLLSRGGIAALDIGGWQGAVATSIDPLGLVPLRFGPAGAAALLAVALAGLAAIVTTLPAQRAHGSTAPAALVVAATVSLSLVVAAESFAAVAAAFVATSLFGSGAVATLAASRDGVQAVTRVAFLHRIGDAALCFAVFVVGTELGGLEPALLAVNAPALEPWVRFESGPMAGLAPREVWQIAGFLVVVAAASRLLVVPTFILARDSARDASGITGFAIGACSIAAGGLLLGRAAALLSLAPEALMALGWLGAATLVSAALLALVARDVRRGDQWLLVAFGGIAAALYGALSDAAALLTTIVLVLAAVPLVASGAHLAATTRLADPRRLGALEPRIPRTHTARLLATGALAGPVFSGAFVLVHATAATWLAPWLGAPVSITLAVGGVILSLAAFRPLHLAFTGKESRSPDVPARDPPGATTVMNMALGMLAVAVGVVLLPNGLLQMLPVQTTYHAPLLGVVSQEIDAAAAVRSHVLAALVAPPLSPAALAGITLALLTLGWIGSTVLFRGGPRPALTRLTARPWLDRVITTTDGLAGTDGRAIEVGEGAVRLSRMIGANFAPAVLDTALRRLPGLVSALVSLAVRVLSSGSAQRGALFVMTALALALWWWWAAAHGQGGAP